MPRPRNNSKIQIPPRIKGFMPIGLFADPGEPIYLNLEEFEVIRLLDYEGISQLEASEHMCVSRPTLTRIYDRARKKIAKALTESHQIIIEGGKAIFEGEWYSCSSCNNKFNNPKNLEVTECILCGSKNLKSINHESGNSN